MEEQMRIREQEIRHMKEMESTVKATESKERLRQAIRDSSWELRELESKLKNAYAVKECLAQIKENEAKKQREKVSPAQRYPCINVSARGSPRRRRAQRKARHCTAAGGKQGGAQVTQEVSVSRGSP